MVVNEFYFESVPEC